MRHKLKIEVTCDGCFEMVNGRKHGKEILFADGKVQHITSYHKGIEHGVSYQFDEKGKIVCIYVLDYGTGVDLWWDSGSLSEEAYWKNGKLHGPYRWWNRSGKSIWQEDYFYNGYKHGVSRSWHNNGRLEKGSLKFFIKSKEVEEDEYIKKSKLLKTLPKFSPKDNSSLRKFPELYKENLKKYGAPILDYKLLL